MYCSYMCVRERARGVCMSMDAPRPDRIPITQTKLPSACPLYPCPNTRCAPPSSLFYSPRALSFTLARSYARSTYIPPIYFLPASLSIADRYQRGFLSKDRNHRRVSNIALISPAFIVRFIVRYRDGSGIDDEPRQGPIPVSTWSSNARQLRYARRSIRIACASGSDSFVNP